MTVAFRITPEALARFTGTERYTRYPMGLVLTDGARFLVENGAAWLIDIIAAARLTPAVRAADYEFWSLTLTPDTGGAEVLCTDGDQGPGPVTLYRQQVEQTDFPLREIRLYVQRDETLGKVVMLTSEY